MYIVYSVRYIRYTLHSSLSCVALYIRVMNLNYGIKYITVYYNIFILIYLIIDFNLYNLGFMSGGDASSPRSRPRREYNVRGLLHRTILEFWLTSGTYHALSVLGPSYLVLSLSATPYIVGLASSMLALGRLLSSVPAGIFVKRFGYKNGVVTGALAMSFACLAAGLTGYMRRGGELAMTYTEHANMSNAAPSAAPTLPAADIPYSIFVVYFLSVFVIGLGYGLYFIGQHTFLSSSVAQHRRGLAFSCHGGTFRVAGIVFPLIAGGFGSFLPLHNVLLLTTMFPLVSSLLTLTFLPVPEDKQAKKASDGRVVEDGGANEKMLQRSSQKKSGHCTFCHILWHFRKELTTVGIFVTLLSLVRAGREILIPLIVIEQGLGISEISYAQSISYFCGASMFPLSGILMDRCGRKVSASTSIIVFACGLVVLSQSSNYAVLVAGSAIVGIGNGISSGLVMTLGGDLVMQIDDRSKRGPFLGAFKTVSDTGNLLGPLLSGSLTSEVGTSGASLMLTGFATLALIWLLCFVRETRPSRKGGYSKNNENKEEEDEDEAYVVACDANILII